MPKAYPTALRDRVLALTDGGAPTAAVADRLMVSPAWVRRVKQRRHVAGPPRPPGRRRPPGLDAAARAKLDGWVAERPDATLAELRARLAAELDVTVNLGCLFNTLRAMRLTYKVGRRRRAATPGRGRGPGGVLRRPVEGRPAGRRGRVGREPRATTQFTRLRGRGRRGERVREHVPHGHWKRLTLLAAMTVAGPLVAAAIDAATDRDVFLGFVSDFLCPALRRGQVVVMDNPSSHKVAGVRQAIEAAGCRLVCLPPYSPDLSPIEPMWSKVKQGLRTAAERTVAGLIDATGPAVAAVTASDCYGYFEHCGYTLHLT